MLCEGALFFAGDAPAPPHPLGWVVVEVSVSSESLRVWLPGAEFYVVASRNKDGESLCVRWVAIERAGAHASKGLRKAGRGLRTGARRRRSRSRKEGDTQGAAAHVAILLCGSSFLESRVEIVLGAVSLRTRSTCLHVLV